MSHVPAVIRQTVADVFGDRGMLPAAEFCRRMGWSQETLSRLVKDGYLMTFARPTGKRRRVRDVSRAGFTRYLMDCREQ